MTPAKTPLLDELAGLEEQVTTARTRARGLTEAIAEHAAELERLKAERVEAYSQDDERRAAALQKRTAAAEAKAFELEERRAGADLAAVRAASARDKFIAAHHGELVAERSPAAHDAVKAIEDAALALQEGVKAWQAESAAQAMLLRSVAGRDGREIPDLSVAQAVRDLRRAVAEGVPVPLPPLAAAPRPEGVNDPDPVVRRAAKAKLRAGREQQADDSPGVTFETFN